MIICVMDKKKKRQGKRVGSLSDQRRGLFLSRVVREDFIEKVIFGFVDYVIKFIDEILNMVIEKELIQQIK